MKGEKRGRERDVYVVCTCGLKEDMTNSCQSLYHMEMGFYETERGFVPIRERIVIMSLV